MFIDYSLIAIVTLSPFSPRSCSAISVYHPSNVWSSIFLVLRCRCFVQDCLLWRQEIRGEAVAQVSYAFEYESILGMLLLTFVTLVLPVATELRSGFALFGVFRNQILLILCYIFDWLLFVAGAQVWSWLRGFVNLMPKYIIHMHVLHV
jgi:hypothetical protein